MRTIWCTIVIIAMLFMGVDGAADLGSTGHPHGSDQGHLAATSADTNPNTGSADVSLKNFSSTHCEHCCHGHNFSIMSQIAVVAPFISNYDEQPCQAQNVDNFSQAPPTPPPTI